jgi:hypothetical protein
MRLRQQSLFKIDFSNAATPPIGYRIVDAEKRGAKVKKKLEIDPFHADTVRLAFRLSREGDGISGRMGVKAFAPTAAARLKRLYDAIESDVADLEDESPKERFVELRALRSQAQADAERATVALQAAGPEITPAKLRIFADAGRKRLRGPNGGYRRDQLRALAQRIEVAEGEVRIMGSRSELLRTLAASGGAKSAARGVSSFVPKWRATPDSDDHYVYAVALR